MTGLVIIRHGESEWNKSGRFTGWADVSLTDRGIKEAHRAAQWLKKHEFIFDTAYCSVLSRAINTLSIIMEDIGLGNIPVIHAWQLNERNLGKLEGLYFEEAVKIFGEREVWNWRRNYNASPPRLEKNDKRYPGNLLKYADIESKLLPKSESYAELSARVLNYWNKAVLPEIIAGKRIILTTHQNVIKVLSKVLENVSEQETVELKIPTATPILYSYDEKNSRFRKEVLDFG